MSGTNDLHRRIAGFLLAGTAMVTLAACGGGGGNSNATNAGQGNPSFFRTAEFQNSEALQQIDADQGYARIAGNVGGGGVRVAVIDDGIDSDHIDLRGNVVRDLRFSGQTETDNNSGVGGLGKDGHGTAAAGVIAAKRNGIGSHGVAFNSKIVSIDVFSVDDDPTNGSDEVRNLTSALRIASDEADIINMSLIVTTSGPPQFNSQITDVENAMKGAAGKGRIIVASTGNNGGANPEFPANFVDDPGIAGLGIAVGSVDANDNISGFSNRCGDTANFCIRALMSSSSEMLISLLISTY